jgi:hypothetical protein
MEGTRVLGRALCSLAVGAVVLAGATVPARAEPEYVNAQLHAHERVIDDQGKLLAWYRPQENLGYDKVLHLGWNFIEHAVPKDTLNGTGLEIYLISSVFNRWTKQTGYWQHNPAMVFGSFVDSLLAWYPYSGDAQAIDVVAHMLDHMLAHGTTPSKWDWSEVPFATGCANDRSYGRCLRDMPREYYGGIEPDKVGELGIGYVEFYELTGNRKYLAAGIRCADVLAAHVRPGDDEHTPWAFRVDAKTGKVLAGEEYGGAVVSPLRLFDELIRLHRGDVRAYQRARGIAWQWVLGHPLNPASPAYDKWTGYFEDVLKSTDNVNQTLPTYTANYLLTRPDPAAIDPDWAAHVRHLVDWVRQRFGRGPFFGAWGIDEQGTPTPSEFDCCSPAGLGSDSSRWAAVNALLYERTGDAAAREDAVRSLNYATYFAASDGRISCCGAAIPDEYWFSDGYSDYLRHFNWVMAALPELAPTGRNHLLRSSSPVQHISYATDRVRYRTFDPQAREVLRLRFRPAHVRAGRRTLERTNDTHRDGYTTQRLPDGDYIVHIRHTRARDVTVRGR